jgi:hypothetical protein
MDCRREKRAEGKAGEQQIGREYCRAGANYLTKGPFDVECLEITLKNEIAGRINADARSEDLTTRLLAVDAEMVSLRLAQSRATARAEEAERKHEDMRGMVLRAVQGQEDAEAQLGLIKDGDWPGQVRTLKERISLLESALGRLLQWTDKLIEGNKATGGIGHLNDHACEQCVGDARLGPPGFVCGYHNAKSVAAGSRALSGAQEVADAKEE